MRIEDTELVTHHKDTKEDKDECQRNAQSASTLYTVSELTLLNLSLDSSISFSIETKTN